MFMPKAVRFHKVDKPLKIEVDFHKIGSNVVLKIQASSLCYSDVHVTT